MLNCCGGWTVLVRVVCNLAVDEERRVHEAPPSSSCPDSKDEPVRCWVDVRLNLYIQNYYILKTNFFSHFESLSIFKIQRKMVRESSSLSLSYGISL